MKGRKERGEVLFILIILIGVVLFSAASDQWDRSKIRHWAEQNGYSVVSIRRPGWFEATPFWRGKGQSIFVAELKHNGVVRTCYFDFTLFSQSRFWKD